MAIKRDVLLEELDLLRDNIIEEHYQQTGEILFVCSDYVLKEIAINKPLKRDAFLAISGIDEDFINQYADRFLRVIYRHQFQSVKEVDVSLEAYRVLDHYKDRLSNISRRNQNLYMGKIIKNKNFDLAIPNLHDDLHDFLTNRRRQKLILDIDNNKQADVLERSIITLYRRVNKYEQETGSYNLYIGYPYVEGLLGKEKFAVKAPLLYVPVKLSRDKRTFMLKKDKEKDIVYNRDLVLAISKMEMVDLELENIEINDCSVETLENVVFPFYQKIGMHLKSTQITHQYIPFKNERKFSFLKGKKNSFKVIEYITLGRYKLYSSMIQKDINSILESNKYNDLLEGLIDEKNLYDDEKEPVYAFDQTMIQEETLSYITDINYSQERVLDLINQERKLVIWGPPGTGKSQTITNLIAASVLKGENVLVISEKKVALEVIQTRLGNSAKYSMFIDDAENKQDFYQKLTHFIDPLPPKRSLNNDIYALEKEINQTLETLNKAIDLLYNHKIQDVQIHRLYKRYLKDTEIIDTLTPLQVLKMFHATYRNISFKTLEKMENTFAKKKHLEDYLLYRKMLNEYPILRDLETKITRSNRIIFKGYTKNFLFFKKKYDKAWFFKKRTVKKQFLDQRKNKLLFLTQKKKTNQKYLDLLFKDPTLHMYIEAHLTTLNKIKTTYEQLSKDELLFLDMLLYHPATKHIDDIAKHRMYIFNAYYTGFLEDFKTKHQKYLYILEKYEEKTKELDDLIQQKQIVNKESFDMELYKRALNLSNTKRIMDIKRVLESSRKLSIKAFIDMFQVELLHSIRVWMLTPEVVSTIIPLVYGMFDLVVIDEASQMYVEKGIPAIYRAKKVCIAGDTKQLRPSSLGVGRVNDEDLFYEQDVLKDISIDAKSLLDLARYKYKETILNFHYRSQYEELIAFSNYAFYEGKLFVSPNQETPKKPPIEYVYVKDGVFENRANIEEAKKVILLLRKIFRERKHHESIGVITFNSSQRDLIENLIDEELYKRGKFQKIFEHELFRKDDDEDQSLFVKNIENVQGDERDIIVFSMGYARGPDGIFRRQFGWLNNDGGQNRLNVAISRAKKKIYFVSSMHPEEFKVEDLNSVGPKLLKDYMSYCNYISLKKTDLAKEVLQGLYQKQDNLLNTDISELTQEIKQRLERNNYMVKTEIGVGNYHLNLAIYDQEKDMYQLGIICEVDETKQLDARRDLVHQRKYLEGRNWNIYRVFASNWYSDPNKEMRKIRNILRSI